ncbi:MAG: STY4851/ECs_5259 family protein [Candidatus Thiodiazotropha lotti]|nr:STY4851/ECs_5259 family protein [Candidatus Thiodiazotropha lotti]
MEQQWTLKVIIDWAIQSGLQPRVLGTGKGVIVSPTDERKSLFIITIAGDALDCCAEIAINKENVRADSLHLLLQEEFEITTPTASHKWPRIELYSFDDSVLEVIAGWASERVVGPGSPAPEPLVLPEQDPEERSIQQGMQVSLDSVSPSPSAEKSRQDFNVWLNSFLDARGLMRADGRPLYAYKTTDEEFLSIQRYLNLAAIFRGHDIFRKDRKFDALFVLFAAEWWRREYRGGSWSWQPIYEAVGLDDEAVESLKTSPQQFLYPALERGFQYWKRDIFSTRSGRTFIGSIAAEGGLPLNLLCDSHAGIQRFFKHLLDRYLPVRASGVPATQVASELQTDLPISYRSETVFRVAGEIVETTLQLRSKYGLAEQDDPIAHLEKVFPEWRDRFSLSLDNEPAQALLRALVVDAAKNSDCGIPLLLSRHIIPKLGGGYRLQASIEIAKKLSLASLKSLFGELEWPSQLEIWLFSPFKARLAVLSRIDDEHYKVRSEGVSWKGCKVRDAVQVGLFSYGSALSEVKPLPESLMEDELPWVFIEKNNRLRYLGQGGMSLAAEHAVLVVPQGVDVLSDENTAELLGTVEDIGMVVYEGSGLLKICSTDGEFSIRTSQPKMEIPQYELVGNRLYREANVRQVFLGVPRLLRRDIDGGANFLAGTDILCRHTGSGETWQPYMNSIEGLVDIKAMEGSEVLFRTQVAILPENVQFMTLPGKDQRTGNIVVTGLSGVRFASGSDGLGIEVSEDDDSEVTLKLTRSDERRSSFPLLIQWPQLPHSLQIHMPIPVAGARFRDANGVWLEDRAFVSVSDLAGIHAIGYNHSGGSPERFHLDILMRTGDFRAGDQRTLSSRIPLPRMGEVSELPLIQLREHLLQLFSLSEDLDCRIELSLEGNRTYGRLQLARYTYQLKFEYDVISLSSARYRGVVEQEVIDGLDLEAHSLLSPIEHGREMTPCHSQGVPTGEWHRPSNLSPGPWLVMPVQGQDSSVRPTILGVPGYVPSDNGRLRDAIAIAGEAERRDRVSDCIEQMLNRYDHKDWPFVFETLSAFQHLPATTLDLWDCFARNARAMAMLLITADETSFQKVINLADELPFTWELVPFSAWLSSLTAVKEHIKESAPDGMAEMLVEHIIKQKLEYIAEADDLLEKVTWILSEIIIQKPVDGLSDARPLGAPGVIDVVLDSASGQLRSRQGADAYWPVFNGNLINRVRQVTPDSAHSLFTQQAVFMQSVLQAPVAMAIRAHALPAGEIDNPRNTELYQIQQIRRFDEQWYKEAFEWTVFYLYASDQLVNVSENIE